MPSLGPPFSSYPFFHPAALYFNHGWGGLRERGTQLNRTFAWAYIMHAPSCMCVCRDYGVLVSFLLEHGVR